MNDFLRDFQTFLREFPNDFRRSVKPAFDFLVTEHGYRLVDFEVSDAFDNGLLIYVGQTFRVQVVRDRGFVSFTVCGLGDYHDFGLDTLRHLIHDVKEFQGPFEAVDVSVEMSARFLKENLAALERLFSPDRKEETIRRGDSLLDQWVEKKYGMRPRPKT
jgi:hypothetical protein